MRKSLILAVLFSAGAAALAQPPAAAPAPLSTRFGIAVNLDTFPQKTAALAVTSAARAVEIGKVDYLAAHLIDPAFVDARVADRAALLEPQADRDLRAARDAQRADPNRPGDRLPYDPAAFAAAVRAEAEARAFRQVVESVRGHLADNPRTAREFRRFLRDAPPAEAGDEATLSLKGEPRQVRLTRAAGRWFVADRQTPAAVPGAAGKD